MSLTELLAQPEVALKLQPEEMASHLLVDFMNRGQNQSRELHAGNIAGEYQRHGKDIVEAVMEAWAWLVREGLIVPSATSSSTGFYQVSRRGRTLKTVVDVDAWRNERWLPKGMLHPVIVEKVWSMFIRGEYDTAVFAAFKEVEVAVRAKSGASATDLGVNLMRTAFMTQPKPGKLTDPKVVPSEQQALSDLFAGAIGSYKNPSSHRHVKIDATQAAEMIVLASHLIRIVDSRP